MVGDSSDSDLELLKKLRQKVRPRVQRQLVQRSRRPGSWEYLPPCEIFIVWDEQGRFVKGEIGQSRQKVLLRYIALQEADHLRCLRLLRAIKRLILKAALDLRCGATRPVAPKEPCIVCGRTRGDMYVSNGTHICGICRYEVRTGRAAPLHCQPIDNAAEIEAAAQAELDGRAFGPLQSMESSEVTHTINRWRPTNLRSMTHYRVLKQIEDEQSGLYEDIWHD